MSAATVCAFCCQAYPFEEFNAHECHQPREHEVRCVRHNNPTWAWNAKCEICLLEDQS